MLIWIGLKYSIQSYLGEIFKHEFFRIYKVKIHIYIYIYIYEIFVNFSWCIYRTLDKMFIIFMKYVYRYQNSSIAQKKWYIQVTTLNAVYEKNFYFVYVI